VREGAGLFSLLKLTLCNLPHPIYPPSLMRDMCSSQGLEVRLPRRGFKLLKSRSYMHFRVGNILVRLQVQPCSGLCQVGPKQRSAQAAPNHDRAPARARRHLTGGACNGSRCNAPSARACCSMDMQRSRMRARARLSERRRECALTMTLTLCMQASRTISAFTVVMVTIALLWYVGASSCTSFFFAFQGFLPMQARAGGLARRPPARTESASAVVHRRHAPGARRNVTPAPLGASRARARGRARRPPARARLAPGGAGVALRLAPDACLLCTPTYVGTF